jgi:opacity protein-like surface antigen
MKPMSSKNFARGIMGAVAMAGLVSFVERSAAADYWGSSQDGDPALPADKVEFASNWYVRGDLAYAQETFPKIAPDFSFDASPSVLNTYSAGAGAGYKVNNWFRTDLILDYRSRVQAAGIGEPKSCAIVLNDPLTGKPTQLDDTCAGHFNTEIHRWDLLANGYVDLVTWGGFTPYIGAGAGVTWARTKQSVNWTIINDVPCQANCGFTTNGSNFYFADFDHSGSRMNYQFAWAAMAGVAIAMTDHAQLDVGYRFLNLGSVTGLSAVTGASVTQRVFVNELRAGVRYMID